VRTADERTDGVSAEAEAILGGPGLSEALRGLAAEDPGRPYLRDRERAVGAAELDCRVDDAVALLREAGLGEEDRVALALPVSVEHVTLIFAVLRLGALWLPLNTKLKGEPLRHQLADSGTDVVIAEGGAELLAELPAAGGPERIELPGASGGPLELVRLERVGRERAAREDAVLLMYTSGTTGPPKGVLVSETMLTGAAVGALQVTRPEPGDVFYVWEPLFHIGGAQVVFLPLFRRIELALAPRFSASRFWEDVRDFGVTHIHYLGGVLQILLQLPESRAERESGVRVAWGAGATPAIREACAGRFGFELNECYGMTETSSIVTVNRNDAEGGIGRALPWFEVSVDESAAGTAPGQGEILVGERIPGLLTRGYLGNPEASRKARAGAWFRTGDNGHLDDAGNLHFDGRGSDSIRVRGENVSAWQVEDVFGLHPGVDRCAVVGVDAQVGEQEMLLLVTPAEGASLDPSDLLEWGRKRLAGFQVPRYAKVIEEMPLTPSQRIAKHRLSRSLEGTTAG
jgi:crotonobetaine/carnitine-CoA ligase